MNPELYDNEGICSEYLLRSARNLAESEDTFNNYEEPIENNKEEISKIGDRVHHLDYGDGTVINIEPQGWVIMFDDMQIKGISKTSKKLQKI